MFPAILVALVLFAAACSPETSSTTSSSPDPLTLNLAQVYSTVSYLSLEVAYEPDAEPYTGSFQNGTPYWWVLQGNMESLLLGRDVGLSIPWGIDDMNPIEDQGRDAWTTEDIVTLARSLWDELMTTTSTSVRVLFLNGHFEDDGGMNPALLGVSYIGTSLMAVFKDVVVASSPSRSVAVFVEQATLVHEAGHILGLVDNGLPTLSDHQDPDHPYHCADSRCVMYWRNEAAENLRAFVQQMIATGSLVMFCDDCLNDAWSYEP